MESKHTKGKWKYRLNYRGDYYITINDESIATVYCLENDKDGTDEENAKLISAAPDLLEALVSLRKWAISKGISIDGKLIINADNAINKAHGK